MDQNIWKLFFVTIFATVSTQTSRPNRLLNMNTVDDYMSICMDGQLHKTVPGPESVLFELCTPWKDWSCCTTENTKQLHTNATWYKFTWDHCGTLSTRCRQYFQQDLCFYECSPNVGPWLVQENRIWRNERFYKVPLCKRECDGWYDACKDDLTCVDNWSTGFQWSAGHQHCPTINITTGAQAPCRKFSEVFRDSEHFCEKVWDGSWEIVPDHQPCMMLDFEPGVLTSNAAVARLEAQKIIDDRATGDGHNFAVSIQCAQQCVLYATSLMFLLTALL